APQERENPFQHTSRGSASQTTKAPKERSSLAQRFSAGSATPNDASPGATTDSSQAPTEALVGSRAAAILNPGHQPFELTFHDRNLRLAPAGTLQTGAAEDSRIYLDQTTFKSWTGITPTTIEIAVNGSTSEIENA